MRLGVVISMYDEHELVLRSIREIRSKFKNPIVVVSHSDDGTEPEEISRVADVRTWPDFSKDYSRYEYPSLAICRNFSAAFERLYTLGSYDLIVGMTGDTLVTDALNFQRIYNHMKTFEFDAMISQAIGQDFHSPDADPPEKSGGRFQYIGIEDFACCLFFLKGNIAEETKAFSDIEVVNRFTSEHCLGHELKTKIGLDNVGRLNEANLSYCYHYSDGVQYHAKSGGAPSR